MASNLLTIEDLADAEVGGIVETALAYRSAVLADKPLAGRSVALLFEKPSLRTRVSFDIGVYELGGHAVYVGRDEVMLNVREPAEDVARVLERWCTLIVARVDSHTTLHQLADPQNVPVINALSDVEHPCQALADVTTIHQHLGRLEGVVVAYVGDANNVANSLGLACAAAGAAFRIASPEGYGLSNEYEALISSRYGGKGSVECFTDPREAVHGADVVYTDVWTSMGQEAEGDERRRVFEGFQVNEALLAIAGPRALFMHDMPAHYGEEVPEGMLLHPQSVAFDQAENRLHAQKAVMRHLSAGNL